MKKIIIAIIIIGIIFFCFTCGEIEKDTINKPKVIITETTDTTSQLKNIQRIISSVHQNYNHFSNLSYSLTGDAINIKKIRIYNFYPKLLKYRFSYFNSTFKLITGRNDMPDYPKELDRKWKNLLKKLETGDEKKIYDYCSSNNIDEYFFHQLTENLIKGNSSLGISESLPIEIGLILFPNSAQLYYDRAVLNTLFQPKNYKFFRQYDLEKANEMFPDNENIMFNLAMSYFDLGYFEQFNSIFFNYINSKPDKNELKSKYQKLIENEIKFSDSIILRENNTRYLKIRQEIIPDYIRIEKPSDTNIITAFNNEVDDRKNQENFHHKTNKNLKLKLNQDNRQTDIAEEGHDNKKKYLMIVFLLLSLLIIIWIYKKIVKRR